MAEAELQGFLSDNLAPGGGGRGEKPGRFLSDLGDL